MIVWLKRHNKHQPTLLDNSILTCITDPSVDNLTEWGSSLLELYNINTSSVTLMVCSTKNILTGVWGACRLIPVGKLVWLSAMSHELLLPAMSCALTVGANAYCSWTEGIVTAIVSGGWQTKFKPCDISSTRNKLRRNKSYLDFVKIVALQLTT